MPKAIPKGDFLKASTMDPLVQVSHEGNELTDDFETDSDEINLRLTANETGVFEIPYDENFSVIPITDDGQLIDYPAISAAEFHKEELLPSLSSEEIVTSSTKETSSDSAASDSQLGKSVFTQVFSDQQKGINYISLKKDNSQMIKLVRATTKNVKIEMCDSNAPDSKQTLVNFIAVEAPKSVAGSTIGTQAGEGVNIEIEANPKSVASTVLENVTFRVTGNAGDIVDSNGPIVIKIPKGATRSKNGQEIVNNLVYSEPISFLGMTSDDDNWILTFTIDTTQVDHHTTFETYIKTAFTAAVFYEGSEVKPENPYSVEGQYAGKEVTDTFNIIPISTGNPPFGKYYYGDKGYFPDGKEQYGILSLTDPGKNKFAVVVNYDKVARKNVVITDTLPEGTQLTAYPGGFDFATGSRAPIAGGIRIAEAGEDELGNQTFHYVSADFANAVTYDKATRKITVNFGDLPAEKSYMVEYALDVIDPYYIKSQDFVKNNARMTFQGGSFTGSVKLRIRDESIQTLGVSKQVDKTVVPLNDNELTYNLRLNVYGGTVPAGATITDTLDSSKISFDSVNPTYDTSLFDFKVTDNVVTITTKKDLSGPMSTDFTFKVDSSNLKPGDKLDNWATITNGGQTLRSSKVTTIRTDGRIRIKKINKENEPLPGAKFEIRDSENVIVDQGTTDEAGEFLSKPLTVGDYIVIETEAPEGYLLDGTPKNVKVISNSVSPVEVVIENIRDVGDVLLTKTDERKGNALKDAEFELQDKDGNMQQKGLKTDDKGEILVKGLAPGDYQFVETKAPEDYQLDQTPIKFTISKRQTATVKVNMTNKLLDGEISLAKRVDKQFIESGNQIDPAKPTNTNPTEIQYTVTAKNKVYSAVKDVRILDILPFDSDTRGSHLTNGYQVKSVASNISDSELYYTTDAIAEGEDPNSLELTAAQGWIKLSVDSSQLKNAKAVVAVIPKLMKDVEAELVIKIQPENQQAGEIYGNDASLNSDLDQIMVSETVSTKVYGRDLSGVAWYDDNLDGLIGNKSPGVSEDWAKEIPVKLYRTSLEDPSYKKELVKESLTGEKFVDDSGKSLKKTNEDGKYLFENLPEGEYIAEFEIEDQIIARKIKVTKQLIGDDPKLNSKADQETYQTAKYNQPILQDLAGLGNEDAKNHVTDVNIGLIRPATIRLFKYETGTAIDADKSGTLTNEEKATGKPLEGAVFDIYEGDEKTPLATETTNDKGILYFDKLFPGDYTLIETKAPDGYELIKEPIKVTITEGNQTIQLYKEDDKQTELPHAGGNYFIIIGLIVSSTILVLGLGAAMFHFRNPKQRGKL